MILCAGEALIDMLPVAGPGGVAAFAPHPGGAVFNTAIALGRLGAPVGFFAPLSSDLFGGVLAEALAASNVDLTLCPRVARPTTLAFVQMEKGQARYAFYDTGSALRLLSPAELPVLPPTVTALFGGGISLVTPPGAEAFATLALRASGAGKVLMLDPNIRPGFIQDEAAYRARLAELLAAADLVKLSDEDLRWLKGPGEIAIQARALLDAGARAVFITEGAKGARVFYQGGMVEKAAEPVQVVDTVGAGDTFNAGALAALAARGALGKAALAAAGAEVWGEALGLGLRAAAVTVSRAGANPPWAAELS